MDIDFTKLDVVTWSWQKVMGGEGAHGMIVLSPRAIDRLETYTPDWPLPKIFRMTKGGALIDGIFSGATINTVSLLCVEDAVDGLRWAESIGGLPELIKRSEANLSAISDWVAQTEWIDFLAEDPATVSNTSICLKITAEWYQALPVDEQANKAKQIVNLLENEGVGYDFGSYRDAPAGLRIWGGATVDTADIKALLPWLDWAFTEIQDTGS
jgi:phosphoserine aminotransferase